ncbi:MAG: COG2426 family protein [Nanobdellota archaeon]
MDFNSILILILLTCIPFIELRFSIPVGILSGTLLLPFGFAISGLGLHPVLVFTIVVIVNATLGIVLFHFIGLFDSQLRKSFLKNHYAKALDRAQRKIHPYVRKYGLIGLALFISIPLPGSGVYSGSIGAYVIGMEKKDFYIASVLGVLIAGIIVTTLTLSGQAIFT